MKKEGVTVGVQGLEVEDITLIMIKMKESRLSLLTVWLMWEVKEDSCWQILGEDVYLYLWVGLRGLSVSLPGKA